MDRQDVIAYQKSVHEEKPEWLKDRLEWFQDLKFGIILHWGIYALWDCCESWPLSPGDDWARSEDMECWTSRNKDLAWFTRDYWALNKEFNPVNFDPTVWAKLSKRAGAKYLAFTTKHHDGFCMWDTATTDYKIGGSGSPFKRDIYKEVCDAFQAEGMATSTYFSKADWHCPDYWAPDKPILGRRANTSSDPERWKKFVDYTHDQIRELMTGYGKIDVLWLDAGWVMDEEDIDMPGMVAMARELQPGLIVANRTVGDEFEDFVTPEREIPEEGLGVPWESCLVMAENWKYHPRDKYRSVADILDMLVDTVSKGGNMLLGVGPTPEGEFPSQAVERLEAIGEWMDINSEAIYGTRPSDLKPTETVRWTQKGEWTYAFTRADSLQLPEGCSDLSVLGSDEVPVIKDGVAVLPQSGKATHGPRVLKFKRA